MGIFNRKSSSPRSEQVIHFHLALELARSVEAEFDLHESLKAERIAEGIHTKEFEKYEADEKTSLILISNFIDKRLSTDLSEQIPGQYFQPTWKEIKVFTDEFMLNASPSNRKLIAELEELVIYYANMAKSGGLIMLPGATLESSALYRAMLLGNQINGEFGWGWEADEKSLQQIKDSRFTQLIARFLTEVNDHVTKGEYLVRACQFAMALIINWESSAERKTKN